MGKSRVSRSGCSNQFSLSWSESQFLPTPTAEGVGAHTSDYLCLRYRGTLGSLHRAMQPNCDVYHNSLHTAESASVVELGAREHRGPGIQRPDSRAHTRASMASWPGRLRENRQLPPSGLTGRSDSSAIIAVRGRSLARHYESKALADRRLVEACFWPRRAWSTGRQSGCYSVEQE